MHNFLVFFSFGGNVACEQALLFGRVKRVSRERARGTFFTFCGVSGVEMKIYERSLQALLSSAPRSRVLARLASLAQIGELARRLEEMTKLSLNLIRVPFYKGASNEKEVTGSF